MYETELAAFELLHPLCKIMERIVRIKRFVKVVRDKIAEAGKGPLILIRMGVGYEIPLHGKWTIAPEFAADFIEGGKRLFIGGFALGYEF